jgi:capsule polysaccharide export protein KpsE/RkpR
VVPSQVTTELLEVVGEFARSSWKIIVIAILLFASLFAADWFVTYCGFSNRCPVVQQVAELPASKLQFLPVI